MKRRRKKGKGLWLALFCTMVAVGYVVLKRPQDTRPIARFWKKQSIEQGLQEALWESSTWSLFSEYDKLALLIDGLCLESMIDIPSRDLDLFVKASLPVKKYIGAVASKKKADAYEHCFGSDVMSFMPYRLGIDPLPEGDLLCLWDACSSLTQQEIAPLLLHIKKSRVRFFLVAHDRNVEKNSKRQARSINWQIAPYFFPEPMIELTMGMGSEQKVLALWSREQIP